MSKLKDNVKAILTTLDNLNFLKKEEISKHNKLLNAISSKLEAMSDHMDLEDISENIKAMGEKLVRDNKAEHDKYVKAMYHLMDRIVQTTRSYSFVKESSKNEVMTKVDELKRYLDTNKDVSKKRLDGMQTLMKNIEAILSSENQKNLNQAIQQSQDIIENVKNQVSELSFIGSDIKKITLEKLAK